MPSRIYLFIFLSFFIRYIHTPIGASSEHITEKQIPITVIVGIILISSIAYYIYCITKKAFLQYGRENTVNISYFMPYSVKRNARRMPDIPLGGFYCILYDYLSMKAYKAIARSSLVIYLSGLMLFSPSVETIPSSSAIIK